MLNKLFKGVIDTMKNVSDIIEETHPIVKDLRLRNEIKEKIDNVFVYEQQLVKRKTDLLIKLNDIEYYGIDNDTKDELRKMKYELNKEKLNYNNLLNEISKLRSINHQIYMNEKMLPQKSADLFELEAAEKILNRTAPKMIEEMIREIDKFIK